jgi:hypothetical protein
MKVALIALLAGACSAAPSYLLGDSDLSVASIESVATNGITKHVASVKHAVELPKQVLPLHVLPEQHAIVEHEIVHRGGYNMGHDDHNMGYNNLNLGHDTLNMGYNNLNMGYNNLNLGHDTLNMGYNTVHQTSYPVVTKTITSLPVKTTLVSSYPSHSMLHY